MRTKLIWVSALLTFPLGCGKSESTAGTESPPADAPTSTPAAPVPVAPARAAPATEPSAEAAALEQRLNGTWVAQDVDAKLGEVKVELTFRAEGPMKLAAWSDIPFVGQVRDKTAPYEVEGNVISSEAIRGGTSVEYWFEGDDLIIKYKEGKTIRFQRQ